MGPRWSINIISPADRAAGRLIGGVGVGFGVWRLTSAGSSLVVVLLILLTITRAGPRSHRPSGMPPALRPDRSRVPCPMKANRP